MPGEYGEQSAPKEDKEISREELYDKFHEQQSGAPSEEEKKEVKKEEITDSAPEEAAQPEEAEKKEAEVKETPKKEHSQVSHAALHEERMKRQAADRAKKEAEDRARELEAEIAKLKSQEIQPDEITDYDKEIAELKRFRQAQENLERQRQEKERKDAEQKARDAFEKTMSDIDNELSEEGYGGFGFAREKVAQEIERLIFEDESNRSLDTKEGWKKVYRENIFPEASKVFAETLQKRERLDKENLKKQANLNTPPNKPLGKPKSDADKSEAELREEYFRMRRGE